jgi:hypothetical protein
VRTRRPRISGYESNRGLRQLCSPLHRHGHHYFRSIFEAPHGHLRSGEPGPVSAAAFRSPPGPRPATAELPGRGPGPVFLFGLPHGRWELPEAATDSIVATDVGAPINTGMPHG